MTAGGTYVAGGAAAGWYPDPQNAAGQRYWDGAQWTEHVAPGAATAAATPPSKSHTGLIIGIVAGVTVLIIVVLAAAAIPVFLSQRAKAQDAAAKADVSTLGLEINIWYVDNPDAAPPTISVQGGRYLLDGTDIGPVSLDVELGGQTGSDWSDWCVWVTNPNGNLKNFEYSAQGSLREGSC